MTVISDEGYSPSVSGTRPLAMNLYLPGERFVYVIGWSPEVLTNSVSNPSSMYSTRRSEVVR